MIPERTNMITIRSFVRRALASLGMLAAVFASAGVGAAVRSFPTAEDGAAALAQAIDAHDEDALRQLFGDAADKLLASGDTVADAQNREKFAAAYRASHKIVRRDGRTAVLEIGQDDWPLPIPLVEHGGAWTFDTAAGAAEILARRIGRNELEAMRVCLAIVAAEHHYATHHLDADGVPVYAAHIVSSPGKLDGLYWPASASEEPSPLGELIAAATEEGYKRPLAPYHGYYYRILTRQGAHAGGGARDYTVGGKLIGGFAVFAYPARHGASGVKSFVADVDGAIYSRDLDGHADAATAAYDPDDSWAREAEPAP